MPARAAGPPVHHLQPSRRAVLGLSVAAGGALAVGRAQAKDKDSGGGFELGRDADAVLHTVRRLTYGPTPALLEHVRRTGISGWLDDQLGPQPDVRAEALARTFPTLSLPAPLLTNTDVQHDPVRELQAATFARATWGERQLAELLVEFWGNHLSIDAGKFEVRGLKVVDDREVVRPHALGRFADLLQASARSPAMLRYLDNASSRGAQPNENYARELLELHTVGLGSGFTQRDVRDAALIFTGWTVDEVTAGFVFRPQWHHVGPVRVLGWRSDNADAAKGLEVGTSLLAYLAGHPATAQHLAGKLVRRLVSDAAPADLVTSTARVYLASGGSTVPFVRHVVGSRHFANSAGKKSQRPLEWFAAAVRALGIEPEPAVGLSGGGDLVEVLRGLGQVPFDWHPPDGYPDVVEAWASTGAVLGRWNVAQRLVRGDVRGLRPFDGVAFLGTPEPPTAGALVDRIVSRILGAAPRRGLREPLLRSIGRGAGERLAPGVAPGLVPSLAALVLSSPDMAVR